MISPVRLVLVQTNRGGHNSATCQAALVLVVVDQTRELYLANNVADDCRKYTTCALWQILAISPSVHVISLFHSVCFCFRSTPIQNGLMTTDC